MRIKSAKLTHFSSYQRLFWPHSLKLSKYNWPTVSKIRYNHFRLWTVKIRQYHMPNNGLAKSPFRLKQWWGIASHKIQCRLSNTHGLICVKRLPLNSPTNFNSVLPLFEEETFHFNSDQCVTRLHFQTICYLYESCDFTWHLGLTHFQVKVY